MDDIEAKIQEGIMNIADAFSPLVKLENKISKAKEMRKRFMDGEISEEKFNTFIKRLNND